MNIDFALILVALVLLTGGLALIDILFFAPRRKRSVQQTNEEVKTPLVFEYARSFFPILLLVLLLRSFLFEPFRIPSGSLEPTLEVGDFILVNKYTYGLRLPVLNNKIMSVGEPIVGDIVVFRWPPNPSIDYIKRFIGQPGDHIQYKNKVLTVNGKVAKQEFVEYTTDNDGNGHVWQVEKRREILNGVKHNIFVRDDVPAKDFDITVPPGHYFAMGDNRDASYDSRAWGFVPEHNIIGRAIRVWFSWDGLTHRVRWQRIGLPITSR